MRRALVVVVVAALVAGAAGCRYRLAGPPQVAHPVAIEIDVNAGRLVHGQASLQAALARELRTRLGWTVAPGGPAVLALRLGEEDIDVAARGDLGIPERWSIALVGTWTLMVPGREPATGAFRGTGWAADGDGERAALETAADTAARGIAAALEHALEE